MPDVQYRRRSHRILVLFGLAILALILALFYLLRPRPVTGVPEEVRASGAVPSKPELVPSDAPIEGPFAPKVTLVEFLDYQCPGCAAYQPVLKSIRDEFRGKIRFVVRQFPLVEIHAHAKGAAIAAVCAHRQGKFFSYSDTLFENRDNLQRGDLERYAVEAGMNESDFKNCLDDAAAADTVIRDRTHGEALGVRGTPTLFVNGKLLADIPSESALREMILKELGD